MENVFPPKKGIDTNQLKMANNSHYSITHSDDAQKMSDIIKSYFNGSDDLTVTDATSNVGGNTINFALNFHKVNAVEINKETCAMLSHNLSVYSIKNVKVHENH